MVRGLSTPRGVATLGLLSAVGLALFVLESLVPMPLPFLKVGLANVATLLALYLFGPAEAVIVALVRVVAGSLLTGTLFSPGFLLSLAGGTCAALVMAGARRLAGAALGPVGLSLLGSATHVAVQFLVVRFLLAGAASVASLAPILLLTALAGGFAVGAVAWRVLRALRRILPETGA